MPNPGAHRTIPASEELEIRGIVAVTLVAAFAGIVVGVVGGAFAWALHAWFDRALALIAWLRHESTQLPIAGLCVVVAGAGLAVAFNAPLAGAAFVIEEVARTVSLRRMTVTLTAVGTSVFVFRMIFGNSPQFVVTDIHLTGTAELCLMTALGALLGLGGALYNRTILFFLEAVDRIRGAPPELKAGAIGAVVAMAGWTDLRFFGSGELQVQSILDGNLALGSIALLFAVRWVLGPLSYAGGTPGGLFAPLLLLGASLGALFAGVSNLLVAGSAGQAAFAIVGMAALFAGVVRAPLTGVVLIVEMTESVALLAPLLLASVAAVVVASVSRSPPIYDTLRARMKLSRAPLDDDPGRASR